MVEIVSLIDNIALDGSSLVCEHGLSMFVSCPSGRFLLDTGASGSFIDNARALGVDLCSLDGVVISHNHLDHIGGVISLLELNPTVTLYIKSAARGSYYSCRTDRARCISIGADFFDTYSDRICFVDQQLEIVSGVHLLSNLVDDPYFVCPDSALMEQCGDRLQSDRFLHELFMVVEDQSDHLTLISSCSHCGIVNIVRTVQRLFPLSTIDSIVGGFHLKSISDNMSPDQSQKYVGSVAKVLMEATSGVIYTCHCTAKEGFDLLRGQMGSRIDYLATGERLRIDHQGAVKLL